MVTRSRILGLFAVGLFLGSMLAAQDEWDNWAAAKTQGSLTFQRALEREIVALAMNGLEREDYASSSYFADVAIIQTTHAKLKGCDFPPGLAEDDWVVIRREARRLLKRNVRRMVRSRFTYLFGCLEREDLSELYADIALAHDRFFKFKDESLSDLLIEGLLDAMLEMDCTLPPHARQADFDFQKELASARPRVTLARILAIRLDTAWSCPSRNRGGARAEVESSADEAAGKAKKERKKRSTLRSDEALSAYFPAVAKIQEKYLSELGCPPLKKRSFWKPGSGLADGLDGGLRPQRELIAGSERLLGCASQEAWEDYFAETATQIALWLSR